MKNKILSFVGMMSGGCRSTDTLTTHLSPTNHPLKHRTWKVITMMVLAFVLGIGQMWANSSVSHTFSSGDVFTNSKITVNTDVYLTKRASHTSSLFNGNNFYIGSNDNYICVNVAEGDVIDSIKVTTYSAGSQVNSGKAFAYGESASDFSTSSSASAFTYKAKIAFGNTSSVTGSGNLLGTAKVVPSISNCKSLVIGRKIGGTGDGTTFAVGKIEVFYTTSGGGGGCTADPAAPTKFEAESITEDGVTFTITDAADAASYDIYYSTSNTAPEATTAATATSTAKTKAITGLTASTEYFAWVRSVCDDTHKSAWVALTGGSFTTSAPDPCHRYFWFSKAADATTAGVTNNEGSFFTTSASGSNGVTSSITIDGVDYAITNRTGNIGADDATIVSFTIPANKAGVLYVNMASSGNKGESSSRTLYLKKGGVTIVTATNAIYGDGAQHNATIENIPSGTYTLHANNNVKVGMFAVKACDATYHTITLDLDGGTGTTSIAALDGVPAYKPADPTKEHAAFVKWVVKSSGADFDWTANVTDDVTLKAIWTQLYTISFAAGEGSGDAPAAVPDKAQGETFEVPANTFTAPASKEFDKWNDGINDYAPGDTYTVGTANVVLTAQWKALVAKYTVIFKDGETTLDTKLFDVGTNPSDAGVDKTKPLYTFAAWQKDDADIALDDAFWATVVKDATVTLTARWTKAYASNADFEAYILANTGEKDSEDKAEAYVKSLNYALSTKEGTTFDANGSGNNGAYAGLKIKHSGTVLRWNVVAGKVVELKAGVMVANGSLAINGGAATTIDGGSITAGNDNFKIHYFYSAAEALYEFTTSNGSAEVIKAITMRDPYTVSFDVNGGDDPIAAMHGTPSVTLPLPTKGTDSFTGWYDGETKVGEAGEKYTPTANITLKAHWEAVSTDARLASITFSAVGTLSPAFNPELVDYTYTIPYAPNAAIPQITGATAVNPNAQAPVIDQQAAAWGGTAIIRGVAQSGDSKAYNITMKLAPKDGVCLVWGDIPSDNTITYNATNSKFYKAEEVSLVTNVNGKDGTAPSGVKFQSDDYVKVALNEGTFKAGDILALDVTYGTANKMYVYKSQSATADDVIGELDGTTTPAGLNKVAITEDAAALWLVRAGLSSSWNPHVDYVAVYRAMNPVLQAITIDERAGVIDAMDDKHFNVLIPYEADLANLTIVDEVVWNAPHATTPKAVISNEGAWIEGDNTYRLMDKDGDYTDYTITLTRDVLKHTVSFNTHGGSAVASVEVEHNAYLTAVPNEPSKEDYIFQYWSLTDGGDEVDITTVQITENKEFHAVWAAEPEGIKLFSNTGVLNTTNFISPAKTTITIGEVEYPCLVAFGSNRADNLKEAKQADLVQYNAATDATKIKFELYNNNESNKTAYLWLVEEGDENATPIDAVEVPGNTRISTAYYTFNGTKNRSFYLTSGAKADIKVLQAKVIESGAAIHQFGQAGYEVNFNKGRIAVGPDSTVHFEGASIHSNDNYGVLNSSNLKPKTYIQFNNAVANTVVKITKASSNAYYVTNDLEDKGDSYTTDKEIVLTTTGTWYIGSVNSGSVAALSKIAFEAPKCEQPTVVDMENIDLCEGDAFMALTVSASVTDGGTLHYQWYKHPAAGDDEAVGTDAASYTPEADGQYYVVVTNQKENFSDNAATSNTITVEHFASAVITTAPLNKRGAVDAVVTLSVAATGKNLSYEWFTCDEDGSNEQAIVPAETGTSLNVTVTAGMAQWYKVKVTSDCGGAEAMAKVSEFVPTTPANVTTSILWDWKNSEAGFPTASGTKMEFTNTSDEELFADVDPAMPNNEYFRSDMLYGVGQYAWRNTNDNEWGFQGFQIKFHTEVAGKVRIYYRAPSSGNTCTVTIDAQPAGSRQNSWGWSEYVEVEANKDIVISMVNSAGADKMTRVQKIEFLALAHRRTSGYNAGDLGTVCLEDATFIEGASLYELQGLDEHGYLAFDEILSGELEAGKPYLFEVINPNKISFYKPIGAAHSDTEIETNGMIGTFAGTTLYQGAENYYYFSGRHIWRVNDFTVSIAIPAHRCYVDMDELQPVAAAAPAPGRRRVTLGVQGTQVVTGIDNLNAGDQPVKVMIDGQMYILRGEKMYDATGRLVK